MPVPVEQTLERKARESAAAAEEAPAAAVRAVERTVATSTAPEVAEEKAGGMTAAPLTATRLALGSRAAGVLEAKGEATGLVEAAREPPAPAALGGSEVAPVPLAPPWGMAGFAVGTAQTK